MYETKECTSSKEENLNKTPTGFEYHWPSAEYGKTNSNWFINFDKQQIYIDAHKRSYDYTLSDDLRDITFDDSKRDFTKPKMAYIKHLSKILEIELLG